MSGIIGFIIGFCIGAISITAWALCRAKKIDEERREHYEEQRRISGSDGGEGNPGSRTHADAHL